MSMVRYIGPARPGVDVGSPAIYCAYDVATAVPVEWLDSLLSSPNFAPADAEAESYVPPVQHTYTDVFRRDDGALAYRDPVSGGLLPLPVVSAGWVGLAKRGELAYASRRDAVSITAHAYGTTIPGLVSQFTLTRSTRVRIEAYIPLAQVNGTGSNGRLTVGLAVNGVVRAAGQIGNATATGLQGVMLVSRTIVLPAGDHTIAVQPFVSGTGTASLFGEFNDDDSEMYVRAVTA